MNEPELVTFSFGETPEKFIIERCPSPYPMQLVGEDGKLVERLTNIGIDAHLEACFVKERGDSYEWKESKLDNGQVIAVKLHCDVSPESLVVLLRRMAEDDSEEAWDLRTSILSTMDIEEV